MPPRRVAVELVVTGSQQASAYIKSFSKDLTALQGQSAAFSGGISQFQQAAYGGQLGAHGKGYQIVNQSLQALGNTIKITSTAVQNLDSGESVLLNTTNTYTGSIKMLAEAQTRLGIALEGTVARTEATRVAIAALSVETEGLINKQLRLASLAGGRVNTAQARIGLADSNIGIATASRDAAALKLEQMDRLRASGMSAGTGKGDYATAEADLAAKNRFLGEVIVKETKARSAAQARLTVAQNEEIAATQEIARLQRKLTSRTGLRAVPPTVDNPSGIVPTGSGLYGANQRIVSRIQAVGEADIRAAINAQADIPLPIQYIQEQSPETMRRLQKQGLGGGAAYGTPQFTENLKAQGAFEGVRIDKDLERNVTRVSASFRDLNATTEAGRDIMQRTTAAFDSTGKSVTTFGRNLSGAGNFLKQLGRDFQKVMEFAIATTVVFGAFQYVFKEITAIRELDKAIRQLSITANLSRPQAKALFEDIADIATQTATPLLELLKATDDIALATKRAGQSSAEWRQEILSLTQSVGILTNLAGIDTVEATDQLVATMKQLGLEAQDLPGVLNKITAVAGGQSNAIADVVKGLGVLAEAGQQAGLTIDDMIATVQTLSQVTSKSPAEVATALKNLIGALSGPAGTKALAQYNIALRDGAGNLRNIIEIYSEIQDKIDTGIIPTADVQGLVRAIAGGPRRAPDAAALLSSIREIAGVTEKSLGATNEALIANAKILDTAAAKFTQLQVAVDRFATTKFADVLNETIGKFLDLLTVLLKVLGAIPTGIYLFGIQMAILTVALKAALAVGFSLTGMIGGLITRFTGLTFAAAEANTQLTLFGRTGSVVALSQKAIMGAKVGAAAGLGVIAAGASLAGGSNPLSAIGSGAQAAGLTLLLNPLPIVHAKALALGILGVGTALQFVGGLLDNNTKSTNNNTEATLDAINAYKTAYSEVTTLTKAQTDANNKMNAINYGEKTVDQLSKITAATDEYVKATLGLINANLNAGKSFEALLATDPGLAERFKNLVGTARVNPDDPAIKDVIERLNKSLLTAAGYVFADNPKPLSPELRLPESGTGTIAKGYQMGTTSKNLLQGPSIDLSTELLADPKRLLDLMSTSGTKFEIPKNSLSVSYMQEALTKGIKDGLFSTDQLAQLTTFVQTFSESVSSFDAASIHFTQLSAAIQSRAALGLLDVTGVQNETLRATVGKSLADAAKSYIPSPESQAFIGPQQNTVQQQAQASLLKLSSNELTGQSISSQDLIEIQTETLKLTQNVDGTINAFDLLKDKSDLALKLGIYEGLKNAHVPAEQLVEIARILGIEFQVAAQAAEELVKVFEEARQVAQKTFSARELDIITAQNSGQYKDNPKQEGRDNAQNQAAYDQNIRLIDSYQKLTTEQNFSQDSLLNLNNALSDVIGMGGTYLTQNQAAELSQEEIGKILVENTQLILQNAVAAGVNADGLKLIGDELSGIVALQSAIEPYQKIVIDIEERITKRGATTGTIGDILGDNQALAAAQAELTRIQNESDKEFEARLKKIKDAFESGVVPGSSGAGSSDKPNVSTLDIPDILKTLNEQGLLSDAQLKADIDQAYKDAMKLQGTIPGYDKEAKGDIVAVLEGIKNLAQFSDVKQELLRKALDNLAEIEKARLAFETKADTISRIRVGQGSFAAFANVPLNSRTGVSVGSPQGPITVNLNINGQILTDAQRSQIANEVGAAIKSQM